MTAAEVSAMGQPSEKMLKNHCCSQAIMDLSLDDVGREQRGHVKVMTESLNGLGKGNICGILAAAIAVLHVSDPNAAANGWQEELMDWFLDEFGGYDCKDIVCGNPLEIIRLCPGLIVKTYEKVREYIL